MFKFHSKSIQTKLLVRFTGALLFAVVAVAILAVYNNTSYVEKQAQIRVSESGTFLSMMLEDHEKQAMVLASSIAVNPLIGEGVKSKNLTVLRNLTAHLIKNANLDYIIITDAKGTPIIKSDEVDGIPKVDDRSGEQFNIQQALAGKAVSGIETGEQFKLAICAGVPIYDESGALVGALSTGYMLTNNSIVDETKKRSGNEYTLFLGGERVATTLMDKEGKRLVGTVLSNQVILEEVLKEGHTYSGKNTINTTDYITTYIPLKDANDKIIGIIFSGTSLVPFIAAKVSFIEKIVLFTVILLLINALGVYSFVRKIIHPLKIMVTKIQEVAKGNLAVGKSQVHSNDEVGLVAIALDSMVDNLRMLIAQIMQMTEQLAASSEELTAGSEQSAQAAAQVANVVTEIAQGAERQVASVNTTFLMIEEISSDIQQAAEKAEGAATESMTATKTAFIGAQSIETIISQMKKIDSSVTNSADVVIKLGERSKEIGQIIGTISNIAGQTNLLALNAAIEAARAGERGRGFAVVADEVRKLAEQSQNAAKQIGELIGEIQLDTEKAVLAMSEGMTEVNLGTEVVAHAGKSFGQITKAITQVREEVQEISHAIQHMTVGSQQILGSVREIRSVSQEVAAETETISAAAEEQAASMGEITQLSQLLAKMGEEMHTTVGKFTV